ncbi:MAG: efflux transporter periplasmic adaptor subunit [Burkholderiales bacterium RIFCSPLOWO2_12_FULL_64_99]|jgi:macrolide-specific efflux system membrane fusion protein|uniref:efflux RND transporter periplasmic adaptor subunit n=1 Tax=Aquabacterium sp. TaxID=1872578 RepID=UPI0008BB7590|nr:efflux RND transporter periplasmic adaptor subunit [Aquabacterium sp.]OGB05255.1 MAG: efflux transporter periplasmic adaptor subunit [Burkholderiales bacterium RIFCSPHIGHO2_12_FULL_63_20]OGB60891.1 MAG: efflux transporter periplasmic adaptor subunit [Burkholderiales bacterium RIFCSPLOWO2_12_FULL_64_99]
MSTIKRNQWLSGWRLAVGVALVAAAGWGIKSVYFKPPTAPQVITAEVTVDDIEDTVLASGTIEASQEVSVGAQVSGQIKRLHVALGDQVTKGQLVAEIDSTTQANTLRNAEAQVSLLSAQRQSRVAQLRQAELSYQRKKDLFKLDAGSKADLDDAEATLATSRADIAAVDAQIRQATISVDTARVNLGYTRIMAPIDGVVIAVVAEEGRTVNALQSAPTIIKLAKLDKVQIKAQISEADVVRVKPGLPVYFTILGEPQRRYEAKLRAIEPVPESEQTDTKTTTASSSTAAIYYNGLFDVDNPEGKLRVAMTTQVFVVLNRADQALVIPATALGQRDRKAGTYEVRVLEGEGKDQQVNTRNVKIGLNNRVQAQVLAGLKAGEKVVVGEGSANGAGGAGAARMPRMF